MSKAAGPGRHNVLVDELNVRTESLQKTSRCSLKCTKNLPFLCIITIKTILWNKLLVKLCGGIRYQAYLLSVMNGFAYIELCSHIVWRCVDRSGHGTHSCQHVLA